ncbi:NAD(P)/FAD-dependent oxidoreductase [Thermodesulforhabdus norvegica]|uniref:Thioredoxin reductase (NADPH) n=1 Tax=Thermodesulforhabdus norvegica TaxID=39841 RepID=A0A1I4SA45_9BACT|nr:FAD-dependent oxidoreductase [Thermodesulforhabdus norvegica]SFM61133.1 thioredoxin reductase (NADPH) [Thermodesulforhabdus norvegica]
MRVVETEVLIIGSGPAGLQAAIHAARKKVRVTVVGKVHRSSAYRAHVENYCCIPHVSGAELIEQGRKQAEKAGAEFIDEDVLNIERAGDRFVVLTEGGMTIHARAIVLAMGVSRNRLGVPGEKEFLGKGVSYCVECDAGFFRDKVVAVVGCESAAVAGSLTLTFYARDVFLICPDQLNVSPELASRLKDSAVHVLENSAVKEIVGDDKGVTAVRLRDGREIAVNGVFIELGAKGAIELAMNLGVELDPETMQFVVTNKKQETNIPGVYAAGDICGPPWQIAKAVGEGCVAGIEAAEYVKRNRSGEKQTID